MLSTGVIGALLCAVVAIIPSPAEADCASTVNSAVDRMMDQQMKEGMKEGGDKMTPEMKKISEDMANQMKPKMKAAMSKSCKDDKWSGDALKCMDDAKTMDEMEKCEAKLTPDQKKNMDKRMNDAMGMSGSDDCSAVAGRLVQAVLGQAGDLTPQTPSTPKAQVGSKAAASRELTAMFAGQCNSDKWSDRVLKCYGAAASKEDVHKCGALLTPDERSHVETEEMRVLSSRFACVRTTSSAVDRMIALQLKAGLTEAGAKATPEMKKAAEDMASQMTPKMKRAMAESCVADTWSMPALKCMDAAKEMAAMEKCEAKLTPEQKQNMDEAMNIAMASEDSAAPPSECDEYKAAIEKLQTCTKMPAQTREALTQAYEQAAGGWADLSPDARATLAGDCRTATENVLARAKPFCDR